MRPKFTASKLSNLVQGELVGSDTEITGVAGLESAKQGEITFVEKPADEKFAALVAKTKAGCLIVPKDADIGTSISLIKVKNPKLAFAQIAEILHPPKER